MQSLSMIILRFCEVKEQQTDIVIDERSWTNCYSQKLLFSYIFNSAVMIRDPMLFTHFPFHINDFIIDFVLFQSYFDYNGTFVDVFNN